MIFLAFYKKKKRVSSTSKKVRGHIMAEIRKFFSPRDYGTRSSIQVMKKDAEACGAGYTDYQKGSGLVDAGCLSCYTTDQRKMLRKIYGAKVNSWSGNKVHSTYKHLIGREYAAQLKKTKKK